MRHNVYVDRDLLMSFDEKVEALAFVREQFDQAQIVDDVWLEIGEGDSAEILQGDQLLQRTQAVARPGRRSA